MATGLLALLDDVAALVKVTAASLDEVMPAYAKGLASVAQRYLPERQKE